MHYDPSIRRLSKMVNSNFSDKTIFIKIKRRRRIREFSILWWVLMGAAVIGMWLLVVIWLGAGL